MFWIFWIFLDFLGFTEFFWIFFGFLCFFWFLSKLLRLLLNVTTVTTGHQKLSKIGQNSIKSPFFPVGKKSFGQSPPQELEVGPRSGPYILVELKSFMETLSTILYFSFLIQ